MRIHTLKKFPSGYSYTQTRIEREAYRYGQIYLILTFDAPLFVKCIDIVYASPDLKDHTYTRLGGLHTIFSFMGADGYIMDGSGMEQLWGTVYASGSLPSMLSGMAYERALRAQILTAQSEVTRIWESSPSLKHFDRTKIQRIWSDLLNENISLDDAAASPDFKLLSRTLEEEIEKTRSKGRTAALWIEKLERTGTLLQFIRAERTGEWEMHKETLLIMLVTFHAAGHLNR